MTPFPLGFDPPGARRYVSTLQTRSAELLADVLCETFLRGHHRYAKRDITGDGKPETFCNVFACDVAEAMSVVLPRGQLANQLCVWLQSSVARELGWELVGPHVAQRMADEGQLAFATWFNLNGPGHIAPLQPSMGQPGAWLSNVGNENFLRGRVGSAFGLRPVTYFAHP